MRKIKTTQKTEAKKKKNLEALLAELLDVHMNKHDRQRTIELADQI